MRKLVLGIMVIVAAAFSQLSLAQPEGAFVIPDPSLAACIALGIPASGPIEGRISFRHGLARPRGRLM